jgi:hypothetical protein
VIGGFAGVLHGSSLLTRDLGLCSVLTPENIQKLRSTLSALHPKHRMTPQKLSFLEIPESDKTKIHNLYLETDLGVVDILSEVTGVGDFKRLSERAIMVDLYGFQVKVISLEDLIQAKEALGRPKDQITAAELREIQKKTKL